MKKSIFFSFTGILFASAIPLFADNCDHPRDDFDDVYCLDKVYIQADKDLNDSYKQLVSSLDKDGKATLKKKQIEWIKNRNQSCSLHENGQFYVSLNCAKDMTQSRTQELNQRIQECKATGCQNSKL